MNILWIEDEERLRDEGCSFLKGEGLGVQAVGTYAEALPVLDRGGIDLLILDWLLPDRSGIDICKEVQHRWKLPVIMLTAKADEFDKVLALEVGADDYMTKPFGMREFLARIKAVARRMNKWGEPAEVTESQSLQRGELMIDPLRHEVWRGTEQVTLTPTEFTLLHTLAKHPGRVYSRMQLLDEALGDAYLGFERTIDSHIRNLRRKVEDDVTNPRYILTVYGVGYKFGESR